MLKSFVAVETINFAYPIKGGDIISAVKQVIGDEDGSESSGLMFHEEIDHSVSDRFINGYIIGQTSVHPYDHIVVTPGSDSMSAAVAPFYKSQSYNQVTVRNWSWPGELSPAGYTSDDVRAAVRELTEKLRDYFNVFSVATKPKTTPVDVFLVYMNESDGQSNFLSVHGSLDEAKEAIPENARNLEHEPDREINGPEVVVDYVFFSIKKQTINIPQGVFKTT
jgi:hypothetical protein